MKYKQMMHRNQFFIGTILHCTYSFWGLRPQTPIGALPLDPAGGRKSPDPLLSRYTPCHYILDKGLSTSATVTAKCRKRSRALSTSKNTHSGVCYEKPKKTGKKVHSGCQKST